MAKRNSSGVGNAAKGLGIGVALGCVAGVIGARAAHMNKQGIKKNVGRAWRNVGSAVEDVTDKL